MVSLYINSVLSNPSSSKQVLQPLQMCNCILCSSSQKFYTEPSVDCVYKDTWKSIKRSQNICCCQRHFCPINRRRKICSCIFCNLKMYLKTYIHYTVCCKNVSQSGGDLENNLVKKAKHLGFFGKHF